MLAGGLAKIDGSKLALTPRGKKALSQPLHEVVAHLFERWRLNADEILTQGANPEDRERIRDFVQTTLEGHLPPELDDWLASLEERATARETAYSACQRKSSLPSVRG